MNVALYADESVLDNCLQYTSEWFWYETIHTPSH